MKTVWLLTGTSTWLRVFATEFAAKESIPYGGTWAASQSGTQHFSIGGITRYILRELQVEGHQHEGV